MAAIGSTIGLFGPFLWEIKLKIGLKMAFYGFSTKTKPKRSGSKRGQKGHSARHKKQAS